MSDKNKAKPGLVAAALGSLGVVFGDIGTSPLYTLQECFGPHGVKPDRDNVLGVVSLIFWALTLVVTLKYVLVLMRADNNGEGGIMALVSLVAPEQRTVRRGHIAWVSLLVIAGAALLYGDGIITPAISVLSAVEGLGAADPNLTHAVVPITVGILLVLFSVQSRGTGKLGAIFGPVMLLWFFTIGGLGLLSILKTPAVLQAVLPTHAIGFFVRHGVRGLVMLGAVVMAVTGGEALYADMGHFGKSPIRGSWLCVVFPALLLSYFGQAALLLRSPEGAAKPFYSLVQGQGLTYAMVLLASMATVIASQGLISAVFSLTHQAMRLGYFPRMYVRHTSSKVEGQIYLPAVNWCLAAACLTLVLIFQASTHLAAAYGLAVSGTMVITSIVFYSATRHTWKWPAWKSGLLLALFLSFDIPFLLGGLSKFVDGGYIPVIMGAVMFTLMVVWCWGRSMLKAYYADHGLTMDKFLEKMRNPDVHRSFPLGVYPGIDEHGVPPVLLEQLTRFHTLPEQVVLITLKTTNEPYADPSGRFHVENICSHTYRLVCHLGYMELPNVPEMLAIAAPEMDLKVSPQEAIYVVGKAAFTDPEHMPLWQRLFAVLAVNANDITLSCHLPPERTIEMGLRVALTHEEESDATHEDVHGFSLEESHPASARKIPPQPGRGVVPVK